MALWHKSATTLNLWLATLLVRTLGLLRTPPTRAMPLLCPVLTSNTRCLHTVQRGYHPNPLALKDSFQSCPRSPQRPCVSSFNPPPLHSMENPDAALLREYGQGAHGFLGLRGLPLLAANRDPTFYEYGARPSTDREVYVSIHSGGHMVRGCRRGVAGPWTKEAKTCCTARPLTWNSTPGVMVDYA